MPERPCLIDVEELVTRVSNRDCQVIDCRFDLANPASGYDAFLDGHIPGATYAHLDDDLAGPVTPTSGRHPLPDPDALATRFAELGVSNDLPVYVYDSDSGGIAARAWWLLRWLGHKHVKLLNGGYAAWLRAGGNIESGRSDVSPGDFSRESANQCVVSTETLLERVTAGLPLDLLDARDAARFRGEVEPIDPVAGHVPGAENKPFADSLVDGGLWVDADQLREQWLKLLRGRDIEDMTVMCGSGVTACHLALAAVEAGFGEPRLYVGSWSEWTRDPQRPVATAPKSAG